MFKSIKGYNKLTDKQKQVFEQTYKKHFNAMGSEKKEKHTVDKIVKIKVNADENCLEVHFRHEWYKYYPNKTWG